METHKLLGGLTMLKQRREQLAKKIGRMTDELATLDMAIATHEVTVQQGVRANGLLAKLDEEEE